MEITIGEGTVRIAVVQDKDGNIGLCLNQTDTPMPIGDFDQALVNIKVSLTDRDVVIWSKSSKAVDVLMSQVKRFGKILKNNENRLRCKDAKNSKDKPPHPVV